MSSKPVKKAGNKGDKKAGKTKGEPSTTAAAASIDDIFATASAVPAAAAPAPSAADKKKKKKKDKTKAEAAVQDAAKKSRSKDGKGEKSKGDKSKSTAKPVEAESRVVEVVDPSTAIQVAVQQAKAGSEKKRDRKAVEDDIAFRDSRGDGNQHDPLIITGRRTEEGFFIFKEAELGINPEAGGTPLCPFDCECCF